MKRGRFIAFLLFLLLFVAGALGWYVFLYATQPIQAQQPTIEVAPGTGISRLARLLADKQIVDSALAVRLAYMAHLVRDSNAQLQTGTYNLDKTDTLYALLHKIMAGKVVQKTFTIIPGWNKNQLIDALVTQRIVCDVTPPMTSEKRNRVEQKLLANFAPDASSIEGLFLADSYLYIQDCNLAPLQLARTALTNQLTGLWNKKKQPALLKDAYQALILASIIEKETGVVNEQPIIAAVFFNRLQKGMRLQTDPTVIYGLGDAYQGNITSAHLRQKTPYNTYVIRGLPPTPISMVSRAALESLFAPAQTDYLYFVGKGDGSHHFSHSYAEHRKAMQHYQIRKRAANYRSSPSTNVNAD